MNQNSTNNKVWRSATGSRSKSTIKRHKVSKVEKLKNIFGFLSIPKIPGSKGRDKVKRTNVGLNNKSTSSKPRFDTSKGLAANHAQTTKRNHDPQHDLNSKVIGQLLASDDQIEAVSARRSYQSANVKVFQPAKSDPLFGPMNTAKTSLSQTYFSRFMKSKKLQWGFKNVGELRSSFKKSSSKSALYQVNYFLQKYRIFQRFNIFMLSTTLGMLLLFFLYLCFFDTFFLIQNYRVTFAESSYLSPNDVEDVVTTIKEDKLLGFIPNNQFWYLSSRSLTIAAQNEYPEIQSIRVDRKIWPRTAQLQIKTEPILITLGINQSEYWRIGYDGSVVSEDDAGLRQNLVIVERPVTFNQPDATLQDYSFQGDCQGERSNAAQNCLQLNRFWFVKWVWNILDQLQIQYSKTVLPSLFDYDVIIELQSGSRLIFDSGTMSTQVQQDRIVSVLDSILGSQVNTGEIAYIDFRQPKKVFLCRVGQPCAS
jgi:hypothetical protein